MCGCCCFLLRCCCFWTSGGKKERKTSADRKRTRSDFVAATRRRARNGSGQGVCGCTQQGAGHAQKATTAVACVRANREIKYKIIFIGDKGAGKHFLACRITVCFAFQSTPRAPTDYPRTAHTLQMGHTHRARTRDRWCAPRRHRSCNLFAAQNTSNATFSRSFSATVTVRNNSNNGLLRGTARSTCSAFMRPLARSFL